MQSNGSIKRTATRQNKEKEKKYGEKFERVDAWSFVFGERFPVLFLRKTPNIWSIKKKSSNFATEFWSKGS